MPINSASTQFQWNRFKGFLRQLTRSKRALVGIAFLVFYVGLAVSAPYLTAYNPERSTFLAGEFAKPVWWNLVQPGYPLSQNMEVVTSPGFTSTSSVQDQGWTITQSPIQSFTMGYNSTQPTSPVSPGSEEITYARSAGSPTPSAPGAVFTVSKSFTWPYAGPPYSFAGSLTMLMTQMQGVSSVNVAVYAEAQQNLFLLWKTALTNQTINKIQDPGSLGGPLDSRSADMRAIYGVEQDPASYIFFQKGTYSYIVQVTIPDQNQAVSAKVTLFMNDLNLVFKGTSFGLLGTDQIGRDIFTELAWGARISLLVGLLASIVAVAIGLAVGLLAGYLGRLVDEILMRTTDLLLVLPSLPLLIVLAALLGPSIWNVIAILALLSWPGFARIIRSQVLTLKERSFIEASKAAGSGVSHIIQKHIVPNVMGLTYVNLALSVPSAIVTEASLAFLGLRDPNLISWGGMLNDVYNNGATASWWWILPPGLSIAILSLSFILIGYALDEMLNPKLRMRR
jgi:peptide/nickel transport system permease protein